MQALNVQFLNQQNVVKTSGGIDDSLKKNESTSSFKSMLETASKKSEVVNKERSVKDEAVASEQSNIDRAEQAEKAPVVAKDRDNSYLTPKKERISLEEDYIDSPSSVESGLEALLVFGQKVVQAADDAVEMNAEVSVLTDAVGLTSDFQLQSVAVSADGNQSEMQFKPELLSEQNDLPANEKAIALEAALAYADDSVTSDVVYAEEPVEQEQEAVSLLYADSKAVSEKDFAQKNIPEDLKQPEKLKKSSVTATTSLFTDKAGNTVISVVDERGKSAKTASLKLETSNSLVAESVRQNGNILDISMVPVDIAEQNILSSSDQTASAVDSTFQQMLSNQIQQSAPEFVKAGNIILKDNNNGTINMNLKPEALGNVKISLHLSDKGIEGQIVVATREAFEAFKQNMDTLRHSFQQSGFENAELNLSFNDNSHSNGSFGQERQQSSEQFFANKTFSNYADVPEKASASGSVNIYGNSSHIDVVA